MSYYGCETCESNVIALLADTDDKTDPKPIRICKQTRLELPESMIGCPKYPYAERKRIVDSCLLCHYCKGRQEPILNQSDSSIYTHPWIKMTSLTSIVFRCNITNEKKKKKGAITISSSCPFLNKK